MSVDRPSRIDTSRSNAPNLHFTEQDSRLILEHLQKNPQDIFLIDFARYCVAHRRYLEAQANSKMKFTSDKEFAVSDAVDHNVNALQTFAGVSRTNRLIRPLYAIDRVFANAHKLDALSVGPRSEMELLSLIAQGFRPDKIRGIDLFSYSPWIDVGNMHKMPYAQNSFDVVIAGWVLAYSDNPQQACREFLRVARDKGIIAIGATRLSAKRRTGEGRKKSAEGLTAVDDILAVFGSAVRNVYVRHESESEDEEGRTIVIFDVNK